MTSVKHFYVMMMALITRPALASYLYGYVCLHVSHPLYIILW
jgi:hypothetical protein